MKYYKLIYSYEKEIEDCLEEFESDYEGLSKEEKRFRVKEDCDNRYAWYEEGQVYSEDENFDGEAVKVSEMVKEYPEDWLEIN